MRRRTVHTRSHIPLAHDDMLSCLCSFSGEIEEMQKIFFLLPADTSLHERRASPKFVFREKVILLFTNNIYLMIDVYMIDEHHVMFLLTLVGKLLENDKK